MVHFLPEIGLHFLHIAQPPLSVGGEQLQRSVEALLQNALSM